MTSLSSRVSIVPLSAAASPEFLLSPISGLGKQTRKRLTILIKAGERLSTSLYLRAAQTGHQA